MRNIQRSLHALRSSQGGSRRTIVSERVEELHPRIIRVDLFPVRNFLASPTIDWSGFLSGLQDLARSAEIDCTLAYRTDLGCTSLLGVFSRRRAETGEGRSRKQLDPRDSSWAQRHQNPLRRSSGSRHSLNLPVWGLTIHVWTPLSTLDGMNM